MQEANVRRVSAREANQAFSRLLAQAAGGEEIIITRRGEPVAKLGPMNADRVRDRRTAAVKRMMARMRRGVHLDVVRVIRDEMHER